MGDGIPKALDKVSSIFRKDNNVLRISVYFLLLFAGPLMTFPSAVSAKDVVICLRAHNGVSESLIHWQATADYLSKRIDGYTIKLAPFESLIKLSAAAKRGEFDYVITNPSSYIEMELDSGASRMLTLINNRHGEPYTHFGSVIFTRADHTDIQSFEDLRGKTLIAVSERAFGGWRVAWGELLKHGIDVENDLKNVMFAGSQNKTVYAVRDGTADAGVVRTDILEDLAESGLINLDDFRALGQRDTKNFSSLRSTDLYPEWALAQFPHARAGLSRNIVRELLDLRPDSRAAIDGEYMGWTVPMNYQPVHETLQVGPYKNFGEVTLKDTLLAYRYWIASLASILLAFFTAGAFALTRNHQLAQLRADMLNDKDVELKFQKLALDEHAIVSITDVKGDITYANEKFCDISGYSLDELLGRNHSILKSNEHDVEFYQELWRTIANGKAWHGEIKNLRKDGGYYWVKATIVPFLNHRGKPFQYVAIRTDISERKEAEYDAQHARKEAEAANMAKSEFLSSMSHELRTPLNAILGFSDMIRHQVLGPIGEEKYLQYAHDINLSGNLLLSLVNQILDIERIEARKYELVKEDLDLNNLFDECRRVFQKQAKDKDISLLFDVQEKLSALHADKNAIFQVLINLIANAVKFTPEGGRVNVKAFGSRRQHVFEVCDTGIGIPRDKLETIKDPFTRHHHDPHEPQDGVGLGLAIANGLIELHGGYLKISSEDGKGTTATVELPVGSA